MDGSEDNFLRHWSDEETCQEDWQWTNVLWLKTVNYNIIAMFFYSSKYFCVYTTNFTVKVFTNKLTTVHQFLLSSF
jgi:hypothetical protein